MTIVDNNLPADTMVFPVESPLMVTYFAESGEMTVDSAVLQNPEGPGRLLLRLKFSADATYRFVCVLKSLEERFGFAMEDGDIHTLQQ